MKHCLPILWLVLLANVVSAQDYFFKEKAVPVICAHRGGFYPDLPENSLAAIEYTIKNCKLTPAIIEVDVRQSADSILYILHDETLNRTTTGSGRLRDQRKEVLRELYLKTFDGEVTNEHILTLEKLLDYTERNEFILMLDIKENIWRETIQHVARRNLSKRCIILTFRKEAMLQVDSLSKDVMISVLIRNEKDFEDLVASGISLKRVIAYITPLTSKLLITRLRSEGIPIMMDMSELTQSGHARFSSKKYLSVVKDRQIDIMITDYPVDVSNYFYKK